MPPIEVYILPEAADFLQDLPFILIQEGYNSTFETAKNVVDDIINHILLLPMLSHHKLPSTVEYHFARYGKDLRYSFFQRKGSRKTTWYIFFTESNNRITVKHISNNWIEGQYIR